MLEQIQLNNLLVMMSLVIFNVDSINVYLNGIVTLKISTILVNDTQFSSLSCMCVAISEMHIFHDECLFRVADQKVTNSQGHDDVVAPP